MELGEVDQALLLGAVEDRVEVADSAALRSSSVRAGVVIGSPRSAGDLVTGQFARAMHA